MRRFPLVLLPVLGVWAIIRAAVAAPEPLNDNSPARTAGVSLTSRSATEPASADFVVGISPFLDDAVKNEVYRGLVRLLVEDLPLNSTLVVFDAFNLKSITRVTLPDSRVFNSPKTRANQFAGSIHSFKQFLTEQHAKPTDSHLHFESALRVPQFFEFLAENLPAANSALAVLLVGSPLYQDAKEPAFSMLDGFFPSDGNLRASRENSVFGFTGDATKLRPIIVHWIYFDDPWINDLHKEKVTRFWTLYFQSRAARLETFCGDLPTALKSFQQGAAGNLPLTARWELDPHETKIEMLRVNRKVDITDWITRDALPETALSAPSVLKGPMKIGIRWKQNIDLDLYASPRRGAETLFFQHARSPEGYYYKDHRSSPGREFEFIEFESPIDAREVEAFVNFYKGDCPGGPRGEVRIEFDGRIYQGQFSIPAEEGNRGRARRDQAEFWARIPVQEILRISPAGDRAG